MKLLKIIPVLLILSLCSFNSYAEDCSTIKMDSSVNIIKKLKCKASGTETSKSSQQTEVTTTENSAQKEKKGILSKIWKKPEWMKKKN